MYTVILLIHNNLQRLSPAFFIFLLITGILIALLVISKSLGLQFGHRYFAEVNGKIFRRRILVLCLVVEVDNPWSFSLFLLVIKDVLMQTFFFFIQPSNTRSIFSPSSEMK